MIISERYDRLRHGLADALAASRQLSTLIDDLPSDDSFRRFAPWLETANAILAVECANPSEVIADHLAALESAARRARPETWPLTNFGTEVKSAWGIFIADIANAREAARDLGKIARDSSIAPDLRHEVEAAPLRSTLDGMLKRLDTMSSRLDELKREAQPERTRSVQQTGLINVYVDEMKTEANVLKNEITTGETMDLISVGRAVERMSELTSDFISTVGQLKDLISQGARKAVDAARQGVYRVVTGARTVLRVLRRSLHLPSPDQTELPTQIEPQVDVPNIVELARETIMRGEILPPEIAEQITAIYFWGDELADARPLASLTNLQNLDLNKTAITDLGPIVQLRQLRRLSLAQTPVTDLAPLANLTQLRDLDLRGTKVSDLSPIAALTLLRKLDLRASSATDLSPLSALTRLLVLHLQRTQVADLKPLATMVELQTLDLHRTLVTDLSPLIALEQLQVLNLRETPAWNLTPLAQLKKLRRLHLAGTAVSDLAPLTGLSELRRLYLQDTKVANLAPIATLAGLQSIYLEGTAVADLRPLASLAQLRELDLRHTHVVDLAGLSELENLRFLDLGETKVENLAPLSGLPRLSNLDLSKTKVIDLQPLATLKSLKTLRVQGTKVANIHPLGELTDLRYLNIRETNVTNVGPVRHLRHLLVHSRSVADLLVAKGAKNSGA